jgi:putative N6-adenine-specific DNA methylase
MAMAPGKRPILITCPRGIAPFLSAEILSLGLPVVLEHTTAVETEGSLEDARRLNLHLRTGQRVLLLLEAIQAAEPQALYRAVKAMPWERWLPEDGYLSVTSDVDNPAVRDSRYANLKCKDAIVDRMVQRRGRRPDSGPERSGAVVHLHWQGDRCRLYLDTSGEPLSRRGYRRIPLHAPMQEGLAAAVVLAAGWRGEGHFVNPMCGSGTLAIEAALIALGRAPGLTRVNFGFMHVRGFRRGPWEELRSRARAAERRSLNGRIVATDIAREAVEAARKNARAARVDRFIEFRQCDFAHTPVPEGGGVVVLNPEYGERLGQVERLRGTYARIGDFFKRRCGGYRGYVFTGNLALAKHVGLRTRRRIPFFNGAIECRLLEYELYAGTRKSRPAGPGRHEDPIGPPLGTGGETQGG